MTVTRVQVIQSAFGRGSIPGVTPEQVLAAFNTVDQDTVFARHRARVSYVSWDGEGDPPVGTRDRWLHGKDSLSRHAITALGRPGGRVYWLLVDGDLALWQPHPPTGTEFMVADESSPAHWETHAAAHAEKHAHGLADREVFDQVMAAALGG